MISLEIPQRKWASCRLEGRTSWIFSSCGRCTRLTTGTSETPSGGLRKGQSPCELLRGPSGFLSRRCRGLIPSVESGLEPEDSSPVLTWTLGYFWSLPRESVLVSSYEAETGLLWMWAGPSCFLSIVDAYVGELLELQQGVKDPVEVPEVRCD